MSLPYRTQRALSRLCVTLLVLLLIAAVALLCWLLWLNRFVLYTKDGVKLDFDLEQELVGGQIAQSQPIPEVSIDFQETEPTEPESTDLKKFSGYYISYAELSGNLAGVRAKVEQLPAGTPVMLDLKSIRGEFYYTSSQGRLSTKVDVGGIDELLAYMRVKELYVIARIPAFRDYYYGLGHVAHGLIGDPVKVSLWMDSERCYWLNPDKEGTIMYIISIITELRTLGVDEVAFYDFRFPDTDKIVYNGDRLASIANAAKTLVEACSTETFTVSFISTDPSFNLPEGRCRLYMENVAASEVQMMVDVAGISEPEKRFVFLTNMNDTRFEDYCVLRPLEMA